MPKKSSIFLLLPIALMGLSSCGESISSEPRRIYLDFTYYIAPKASEGYSIKTTFFSRDNRSQTCDAVYLEPNPSFEFGSTPCFWRCDAPDFAVFATFDLYFEGDLFSTVAMQKMTSVCFVWSASNFHEDAIQAGTGFQNPSLSAVEFSAFVLFGLDIDSSSYFDGFNAFDGLKSTFYDSLLSDEKSKLANIFWDDPVSKKKTSAEKKWNALQEAKSRNPNSSNDRLWLYWALAILIFAVSLILGILFVSPKARAKFKFLIGRRKSR